jgi:hypothetical protein
MKARDINIKDPYVLEHGRKYYLYGTRGPTVWGPAESLTAILVVIWKTGMDPLKYSTIMVISGRTGITGLPNAGITEEGFIFLHHLNRKRGQWGRRF